MTGRVAYSWGPQVEEAVTRFRLWAPNRDDIRLEIPGAAPVPMKPTENGWCEALQTAPPGTPYRFRVGEVAVPDPASRAQAGGVHGASVVSDPAYAWRNTRWRGRPWQEAVVYELHPGLMGGFGGIEKRLGPLCDLGITAIELMPVAAFPGARNWGYDGVLAYAPDENYGTPDALKHLIDEAHGAGLMVFLDVVYNHFGPDGNYLPLYADGFFRSDRHTPWGDAIDFRRPQVQRYFIENALYWIHEFRVDGLRLDAVHAIGDNDFLHALAAEVHASLTDGRHVHLIVENENNTMSLLDGSFQAQWNDDIHHALHVLLTGENAGYYEAYADAPTEHLARALRDGFVHADKASTAKPQRVSHDPLPPTSFIAILQNHDHVGNRAFGERLTRLVEPEALEAAIALVLLSPQIPLIFMGEEVGAATPFLYFCDHRDSDLAGAVREGRRSEFAKFPEFADEARRESIPDPNALETYERSRPRFDGDGAAEWQSLYRALLALRRDHIVPRLEGTRAEFAEVLGDKAVLACWRMGDGARLTLAANLGTAPARARKPAGTPLWGRSTNGTIASHSTLVWIEAP